MYTFSAASSRSFQVFSLNLNTPWGLRATIREVETTSLEIIFVKGDFINIIPKDILYSHLYKFLLDISIMAKFFFFIFLCKSDNIKNKIIFFPKNWKGLPGSLELIVTFWIRAFCICSEALAWWLRLQLAKQESFSCCLDSRISHLKNQPLRKD